MMSLSVKGKPTGSKPVTESSSLSRDDRKYNVIYCDCAWSYNDKGHAGKRGVEYKYPTMTDEQILSLPVSSIAADDCYLFLWATCPRLDFSIEVIQAWGFKYKTVAFNWVKRNKKSDSWFWGLGHHTRSNSELCLLGVGGKPKRVSKSVHQIVDTSIEMHSKKPDVVRERIVQLCGEVPRIELFARQTSPGWDSVGFDVGSDLFQFFERDG